MLLSSIASRHPRRSLAIVSLSLSIAGCIDKTAPTAPYRGWMPADPALLSMTVSARVTAPAQRLRIVAGYARAAAPAAVLIVDSVTVSVNASGVIPVRLNVAACLADSKRELPNGATADVAKVTCVLHLTAVLLEDGDVVADNAVLEPVVAQLGEQAVVPEFSIGNRELGKSLAVSSDASCVLSATGAAYCWGENTTGELGTGDTLSGRTPRPVAGGLTFRQIALGVSTCALSASSVAYCWGANSFGQLGNGSTARSLVPVAVAGGLRFESISVGFGFACGVTLAHDGYCWGKNDQGQLGTGDTITRTTPTQISGGIKFAEVSAGFRHTCARALASTPPLFCWGLNTLRQLGAGSSSANISVPTAVATPQGVNFTAIRAGELLSCGIGGDSTAYCWGTDRWGELGTGTTAAGLKLPTVVAGGLHFAGLSAGKNNQTFSPVCGWTANGSGYCWGPNDQGQLGNPSTPSCQPTTPFVCVGTPQRVQGNYQFTAIAQGGGHGCGILASHTVVCWGTNFAGQLGDGTTTSSPIPIPVAGLPRTP